MRIPTTKHILRGARLVVGAALIGILPTACDTFFGPGPELASIQIDAVSPLSINTTQQFVAVGKDKNGRVVRIDPVWTVVANGGTINSSGLFTAGTVAGTFTNTVTATSGDFKGTATVIVTAGSLSSITVAPKPDTLAINGTRQYTAVGKDLGGNVVAITPTWSVAALGGAISSTGMFTAGTLAGTFTNTVTATSGGTSGSASVTVLAGALATVTVTPGASVAINGTQQYVAVGKDAFNNVVAIAPTWSIVAGGGVITAGGMFTAGSLAGVFANSIKAISGAISGTTSVTVISGTLASIDITPNPASLVANATQQFTAVGRDAGGNIVAVTPTWSVVASGGAINASGLFTAGAATGSFANTVKATSGTIAGTSTVSVTTLAGSHGPAVVNLGSAANYVILAKSAISNVPTSAITGDLGLSPAAASFVTGFALTLPAGGAFSTSSQVTGGVYASDYATPTPSNLTTAIGDMQTAYTDAAGRPTPDFSDLNTGSIGGLTLPPGLYKWSNTVTINSDVTLNGSATDVWIFQIAGGITQASATHVLLTGGALAKNVFWQSFGVVSIGTTAHMEGQVMSQTSITLATGASHNGRLLAQTAVTLAGNAVVKQ